MSSLPGEGVSSGNEEANATVTFLIELIRSNETLVDEASTAELIDFDNKKLKRAINASANTDRLNSVVYGATAYMQSVWQELGVDGDNGMFTAESTIFRTAGSVGITNKLNALQKLSMPFIRDALFAAETVGEQGNDCRKDLGHSQEDVAGLGLKAVGIYCAAQRGKAMLGGNLGNGERALVDSLEQELVYTVTGEESSTARAKRAQAAIKAAGSAATSN